MRLGRPRPRRALTSVGLCLTLAASFLAAAPTYAADPWTVVVGGLDNPRGLAFGPNGTLYVAEAGRGGTLCPAPDECAGLTSRISGVDLSAGTRRTLVGGLISLASADGSFAIGADGISVHGEGGISAIIGANTHGIPPGVSGPVVDGARAQLGRLITANPSGHWRTLANVGDFDYAWTAANKATLDPNNPEWPDANPYGVLATAGGRYLVDSGSNTLDWIGANGRISVLAWFPNPVGSELSDAVPDCITQGARGIVIGDLAGRLWRYAAGSIHQVALSGAPVISIGGCATWGSTTYLTDIFAGDVLRIDASGAVSVVASGLTFPTGIAAHNGSLYVSNFGTFPGAGQIIRIAL